MCGDEHLENGLAFVIADAVAHEPLDERSFGDRPLVADDARRPLRGSFKGVVVHALNIMVYNDVR